MTGRTKPIAASQIDITYRGRPLKAGLHLWHLDSDHFKSWMLQRLDWPADAPGTRHISEDATDDYCQQLTAEARMVKPSGQATWIRVRRDNHYLDCEALNVAAAYMLNLHAHRAIPVPVAAAEGEEAAAPAQPTQLTPPARPRVIRSAWMQRLKNDPVPRW